MFSISNATFADYKVVWQAMGKDFKATVAGKVFDSMLGEKIIIPSTNTTAFIPADCAEEAHYFCGLINSTPSRLAIQSFSAAGRGLGTPSILNHLKIPKYAPLDSIHQELSQLSLKAHELAQAGRKEDLKEVEDKIDLSAAKLWNLTIRELEEIKSMLKEIS